MKKCVFVIFIIVSIVVVSVLIITIFKQRRELEDMRSHLANPNGAATQMIQDAPAQDSPVFKKNRVNPQQDATARTNVGGSSGRLFAIPAPADPKEAKRQLRKLNAPAIDERYSALYQQLGFTKDEQERFRELRLDFNERSAELFRRTVQSSQSKDRSALQTTSDVVNDQIAVEYDAALREAFGAERADAVKQFDGNISVRNVVNQLERLLASTTSQLVPSQTEQLVNTIAENARRPDGKIDFSVLRIDPLMTQVSGFLSSNQLIALRPLLDGRVSRAVEQSGMTPFQSNAPANQPQKSPEP